MALPGWRDWAFAAKTFAGALLALWLAFYLHLDRPYWAMATAYIVAQPLTGAMRSKSAYRFAGTFIGAVVTVILVPNLVDAPALLVTALALWVAMCIYFALLDRTPRSYLFLLSGYTAALIGFPAVDTPDQIWDLVLARVEEITLGIGCSTLVGTLILPVPIGPGLAVRVDALLRQARAAAIALLSGLPDTPLARAARRKLAADATEVGGLAVLLAYDTSVQQAASAAVILLHQRITLLVAVLSGTADRIAALRDAGAMTPDVGAALDRVTGWLGAPDRMVVDAAGVHAEIAALETALGRRADWNAVMLGGLLMRLHELTNICHDIAALRGQLQAGRARLPELSLPHHGAFPRHRDHVMALYSGAAAALTVGLVCAFWIATAWPEGSGAASLAAVACSFFAAQDDPVPSLVKFIYGVIVAVIIDAVYLFAILPVAHDFEMLALALAPTYLLLGALMAQPRLAPVAGPVAFISATLMTLSSSFSADFAAYANGAAASVVGLAGAAVGLRLMRSVGANWTARRLLRVNRRDIADAAAHAGSVDRLALAALMLDRLGEIMPRMAASAEQADGAAGAALAEIRVGINVVDLQHAIGQSSPPVRQAAASVLGGIARHFRNKADGPPDGTLLTAIDAAIRASCASDGAARRDLLLSLAGLRRALFRDAAPYSPGPAAPRAAEMAA